MDVPFKTTFAVYLGVDIKVKQMSLMGLLAIYVYLLGVHIGNYSVEVHEYPQHGSEMMLLDYDSASYGLIPISESSVHAPVQSTGSGGGANTIYLDVDQAIDRIYASWYSSYSRNYEHVLIRFRKSDLIFPFHSFW